MLVDNTVNVAANNVFILFVNQFNLMVKRKKINIVYAVINVC